MTPPQSAVALEALAGRASCNSSPADELDAEQLRRFAQHAHPGVDVVACSCCSAPWPRAGPPAWRPCRSPGCTCCKRLLQHNHGEDGRARRDVARARARRLFVAVMPVPASPSGGHSGMPARSRPDGSSSAAPASVSVPAGSPAVQHAAAGCRAVSTAGPPR